MIPDFAEPAARHRWIAYFQEVDRLLARTGAANVELRADLRAHVIDSMAATRRGTERDRLEAALARLGQPVDYLDSLLADHPIKRSTRPYDPAAIARGLMHATLAGSRRAVIAVAFILGYLLLATMAAMAILKPVWGDHVGLFRNDDGMVSAGIIARPDGMHELLGWWSMPIALALSAVLYVGLTKGLRAVRG